MAIVPTVLAAAINTTDATSFTTASIAVGSHHNELITVMVYSPAAADPNIPTFTQQRGLSLTQVFTAVATTDHTRMTLFRSCISSGGTTGTFTIDWAGQTQTLAVWDVIAWTGTAATAANNGSDGIGVSNQNVSQSNGTSLTVTLAALQSGSASMAGFAHNISEGTTPGTGYSGTSGSSLNAAGPGTGYRSIYKAPGDTTPNASWTSNAHRYAIGVELLLAGAVTADTEFVGAIPI